MDKMLPLFHPKNSFIVDMVKKWKQVAKVVTVWDNCDDFSWTLAPWPNYRTQAIQIQQYAQLGVTGYLAAGVTVPGPDMAALRTFVSARAMFDPFHTNVTDMAARFCHAYYGAAADSILEYMQLMENSFQTANRSLDYRGLPNHRGLARKIGPTNAVYANETLIEGGAHLKGAMHTALGGGEPYVTRVQAVLLSLQYVVLLRWTELHEYCIYTGCSWPFSESKADEFSLFALAYNATRVRAFDEDDSLGLYKHSCNLECFRKEIFGSTE
jgi:hypothetical protein